MRKEKGEGLVQTKIYGFLFNNLDITSKITKSFISLYIVDCPICLWPNLKTEYLSDGVKNCILLWFG